MVFAAWVARSAVVTSPVAMNVPVTVGFAIVGADDRATLPEPVTELPSAVATPVPRPDTPVEIGRPVPFVSVTDDGVPRFGVTSVGEFERTREPVPVELLAPLPPLETDSGF
jgi:hypothetical protein